jgi:hypothetical protein
MSFALGEAYQFDWRHGTITLQGAPLTVKAAHMKLPHSRMPFVRVSFRETPELAFEARDKGFVFRGGIASMAFTTILTCLCRIRCYGADCGGGRPMRPGLD